MSWPNPHVRNKLQPDSVPPTTYAAAPTQAATVELATLTSCERDEAATQQARLERLRHAQGRAQKQAQAATRFARAEQW